jgi:hypothetical protein
MARGESHIVTRSEGVQAWRDDRAGMNTAELSALTREGVILLDRNAGVYLRVMEEPAERGPESERSVSFEDDSGQRVEYQLDRVRTELISGEIEPVPKGVVEHSSKIAREIASYELAKLDTLPRDEEYSVVEHTETLADAKNAVQLAGISHFGEGDDE